jgi:hypothetical protein
MLVCYNMHSWEFLLLFHFLHWVKDVMSLHIFRYLSHPFGETWCRILTINSTIDERSKLGFSCCMLLYDLFWSTWGLASTNLFMGAGPHHFAHRFRIARLVSPLFSNGFFFSRRIIVNWRWDFVPGTLYLLPGWHQELWFWSLKLGNHSSVQWYTVLLRPEIWWLKTAAKKYDCRGMNT